MKTPAKKRHSGLFQLQRYFICNKGVPTHNNLTRATFVSATRKLETSQCSDTHKLTIIITI